MMLHFVVVHDSESEYDEDDDEVIILEPPARLQPRPFDHQQRLEETRHVTSNNAPIGETFVFDTCSLIRADHQALLTIGGVNRVVIPAIVVQELDKLLKRRSRRDDVAVRARAVRDLLLAHRTFYMQKRSERPVRWTQVGDVPDDDVLACAVFYSAAWPITLITEDKMLKLKAAAEEIPCQNIAELFQRVSPT